MLLRLAPLALALVAQPAAAQVQPSAPIQQPLPAAPALPSDTPWPGGPMTLEIDASDTRRALYRVVQTIPVPAGMTTLSLLYPEWLPGNHAPRGPIGLVSDIRPTAGGRPLAWKRNPLDVYQIDIALPPGTREVTLRFVHTSPITGSEGALR
jgi:hypothetical protein